MYVLSKIINLQNNPQNIRIDTYNFVSFSDFLYLGAQVNNTNDVKAEIKHRVYLANKTACYLLRHLGSQMISRTSKFLIYNMLIKPVITYGSEIWTMSKQGEILLGIFEQKIFRH